MLLTKVFTAPLFYLLGCGDITQEERHMLNLTPTHILT